MLLRWEDEADFSREATMRISFDLDDTLICHQPSVPREPALGWFARLLSPDEPLRLGARALLAGLRHAGHEVWVYTTSHRDPWAVWWWLRLHGVAVGRVINQDVHDRHLRRKGEYPPSKNPAAFGIHLHVDDLEGVAEEGRRYGFRVVVVSPQDERWTEKVWTEVR
ncbi:MAG: hypothetical protein ACRC33_05990 [Gemmataceae bacterium]